jgi:cytochrome d ubiquinol oxidase subunit I
MTQRSKSARVIESAALATGVALLPLGALAQSSSDAESYPSKPIRMLVGFSPGGGSDIIARILGQKMSEAWNQQVVVDNRAGAGGLLASEMTAKAAPTGYTLDAAGGFATIDPVAAMRSPAAVQQALHMLLASYAATGIAVAGVHAWMLLRGAARDFHLRALTLALVVGAPAALLQPLSGDLSARVVAVTQPVKLAALEAQWETERGAPLRIGGVPDAAREETRWALEIPYGLSLLAFHDPGAEVKGLRTVSAADRPPVAIVHLAFQVMVALGSAMALVALWVAWTVWRGRDIVQHRLLLRALVLVAPFGFLATEAGWIVTEVGRQPWVVQGLMRTASAVTPMPGLVVPMLVFTCLYLGLGAIVVTLVASLVRETARASA